MATLADLAVGVGVDDSGVDKGTRRVQGKFDKLWKGVGKAATVAGAAIGGALTVGVVQGIQREAANDLVAAQLRLGEAEQEMAGRIAGDLYANAWGESLQAVQGTFAAVFREVGNVGEGELKDLTLHAQRFADVFQVDAAMAVKTAGALVKNQLAPDMASAFDTLTGAAQTLNIPVEEILDNLNEYAEPIASLGLTGPKAIGLMNAAMATGVRDVDKALDAVKEFSIRAIDGSESTKDAYDVIGLSAKSMASQIAEGGPVAENAMANIIRALMKVEDPVKQDLAGVALFGTMWEDLGPKAIAALDPMAAGLVDVAGRSAELDGAFDNNAAKITTWKRQAEGWLINLAEAPGALGQVGAGVAGFGAVALASGANIGGFSETLAFTGKAAKTLRLGTAVKKLGHLGKVALVASGHGLKAAGMWVVSAGRTTAAWVRTAAVATGTAAKTAAVWVASAAKMTATMALTVARVVAGWVLMAVQSLIQAARMAIAWLIAMGPIALIIAAVIGLVVLIVKNWDTIWSFTKMIFGKVWGFLKGLWDKVKEFIGRAITGIKDIFFKFHPVGIIMKNWDPIWSFIKGLWDKVTGRIRGAVDKIKGFLSGMWDAAKSGARSALNGAIGLVNTAIGGINTLIRTANKLPGVSIPQVPQIPRLAAGGIVTGPTLALLGEGGLDEAVIPLPRGMRDMGDVRGSDGASQLPDEFTVDATVDLGEGITRVVEMKLKRKNQGVVRRNLAGAGRAA